jgi:hypothetical protein
MIQFYPLYRLRFSGKNGIGGTDFMEWLIPWSFLKIIFQSNAFFLLRPRFFLGSLIVFERPESGILYHPFLDPAFYQPQRHEDTKQFLCLCVFVVGFCIYY